MPCPYDYLGRDTALPSPPPAPHAQFPMPHARSPHLTNQAIFAFFNKEFTNSLLASLADSAGLK